MNVYIKQEAIATDHWEWLDTQKEGIAACPLPKRPTLFPLAFWQQRRADILSHCQELGLEFGLALPPETKPDELFALKKDFPRIAVIALIFPKFSDGRAYTLSRLLRERLCYTGEIRAVGDILPDQLFSLRRVGFDAFVLKAHHMPQSIGDMLFPFQNPYQGDIKTPPLFRQRTEKTP